MKICTTRSTRIHTAMFMEEQRQKLTMTSNLAPMKRKLCSAQHQWSMTIQAIESLARYTMKILKMAWPKLNTTSDLLYWGGLLPSNPNWTFRYRQYTQNGFTTVLYVQSEYPYAGHLTHPGTGGIIPQQDINFGIPKQLFYSANGYTGSLLYTNANLFNVFHRNHVIEITNKDSKLMTAMFYLEPLDIMNLDFRDQIQIDNSYWRINEIKDYNPFKEQLTKVELFKVIVKEPLEVDTFQVGQPKKISDGLAKVNAPVVKKVAEKWKCLSTIQWRQGVWKAQSCW